MLLCHRLSSSNRFKINKKLAIEYNNCQIIVVRSDGCSNGCSHLFWGDSSFSLANNNFTGFIYDCNNRQQPFCLHLPDRSIYHKFSLGVDDLWSRRLYLWSDFFAVDKLVDRLHVLASFAGCADVQEIENSDNLIALLAVWIRCKSSPNSAIWHMQSHVFLDCWLLMFAWLSLNVDILWHEANLKVCSCV